MAALKVQVMSRKLIKPSNPTPQHLRYFKPSLFDQLAPPAYITLLLYYPASIEDGRSQKARIFSRLEKSLSETLPKFYPLAGRFDEDNLLVDCSDQGVEYLEAEVEGDLNKFLQEGLDIELLGEFVPQDLGEPDAISSPLVAIQINLFDCGGVVVGVHVSHKVSDTCCLSTFINGWAKTSRDGKCLVSPSFEVASLFPVRNSDFSPPHVSVDKEYRAVTKRFIFDGEKIAALKSKFRGIDSCDDNQPSRVTVVSVVIWKALIHIAEANHGYLRPSLLAPAMNLRGKVAQPTSENLFGNFWMPFIAHFRPSKNSLELEDLVSQVVDAVRNAKGTAKASGDDIVLATTNAFREVEEELLSNNLDAVICTSWCGFPMYDADFGWGKPSWVSTLGRSFTVFTLSDTKFGHGIEAWVSLSEKDMVQFQCDPDITDLTYF